MDKEHLNFYSQYKLNVIEFLRNVMFYRKYSYSRKTIINKNRNYHVYFIKEVTTKQSRAFCLFCDTLTLRIKSKQLYLYYYVIFFVHIESITS